MSKEFLYHSVVGIDMAVNESRTAESTVPSTAPDTPTMTSDRYCRHCSEIALVYDPSANQARCRSCGELA